MGGWWVGAVVGWGLVVWWESWGDGGVEEVGVADWAGWLMAVSEGAAWWV